MLFWKPTFHGVFLCKPAMCMPTPSCLPLPSRTWERNGFHISMTTRPAWFRRRSSFVCHSKRCTRSCSQHAAAACACTSLPHASNGKNYARCSSLSGSTQRTCPTFSLWLANATWLPTPVAFDTNAGKVEAAMVERARLLRSRSRRHPRLHGRTGGVLK